VPYWSRVVSHRGIDLLNRALEKYRLGQSEPIFEGGKLRGIPSPKSDCVGRKWISTTSLLTACNVLAFLQRSPSTEPCFLSVTNQRLYGFEPVNALPYHGIAEAGNLHLPQTVEELDGCLRARERIFPMPVTNEVSLTKSGGTRCQEY
jgi:hypothetical protein